ncbi:MAG: hypothetical protein O9327_04895 [Polaromonas sp.]|nr:hypothetical protein [Polaromonas sp.]
MKTWRAGRGADPIKSAMPLLVASLIALSAPWHLAMAQPPLARDAHQHATTEQRQEQAQAFWRSFRSAVERGDWASLAKMSRSPLTIRGEVDSIKPQYTTGKETEVALRRCMSTSIFAGKGKPSRTLAEWVMSTQSLEASHWVSPTQIRFQNLEFQFIGGTWKLASVFDEDL